MACRSEANLDYGHEKGVTNIIANEQGTGSNDPPLNTYGYQACETAPNSPNDIIPISGTFRIPMEIPPDGNFMFSNDFFPK